MKKKILAVCLIAVIVLGVVFKDSIIRSYVLLFNEKLETYAAQLLEDDERKAGRYGLWKTSCIPGAGMVEFRTGGWGLAPSSTYKGFYYSADNEHNPFSAAGEEAVSMEIDGDRAVWTDGTDNRGTSLRIAEKWFWYEASF